MKRLFIIFALLLSACSFSSDNDPAAPQDVATPAPPENGDDSSIQASTPSGEVDFPPTEQPEVQVTRELFGDKIAINFGAQQESGGLLVEIARVLIADKTALEQDFDLIGIFEDKPVVGEIIFKITNNTEGILTIYPEQGVVIIGTEQINLGDFYFATKFGDAISGDIYPGVTVIGGLWFGIKRSSVSAIHSLTIAFDAPINIEYETIGENFQFEVDLSKQTYEELPDELR
ncbi:MAG: hypothetical protein OEZ02_12760 [Anaerolineae bacterium]|nr:hypothetical protein [Anaerolineae bacterium]